MAYLTEKQVAARLRKTLDSCHRKILVAGGKYGGDFPYLEGVMQDAANELLNAIEKCTAE